MRFADREKDLKKKTTSPSPLQYSALDLPDKHGRTFTKFHKHHVPEPKKLPKLSTFLPTFDSSEEHINLNFEGQILAVDENRCLINLSAYFKPNNFINLKESPANHKKALLFVYD